MSAESDYANAETALTNHASTCATCTAQPDKVTQCNTWDSLNSALQDAGRAVEAAKRAKQPPQGL